MNKMMVYQQLAGRGDSPEEAFSKLLKSADVFKGTNSKEHPTGWVPNAIRIERLDNMNYRATGDFMRWMEIPDETN